jgi:hypothetical protein
MLTACILTRNTCLQCALLYMNNIQTLHYAVLHTATATMQTMQSRQFNERKTTSAYCTSLINKPGVIYMRN